ncbi:hypothetical protein [Streptomyces sp. NPDC051677]|uniref:hypothetical protein n=1 Tax=Streptomyces sp. NPDC051677 TaxID=3365669 RepID=UPI0037D66C11
MTVDVKSWVRFVRRSAESKIREGCRARRRLCLLVVEHGAPPPERIGPYEDWVRPPIVPEDLQARVGQLEARVVLTLSMLRLRRRLQLLGLTLRNVWGRGSTVEPNQQNQPNQLNRPNQQNQPNQLNRPNRGVRHPCAAHHLS